MLRVVVLVVALTAGVAAASCAPFRGSAFPAEGSVVPPNPTFYVQVEAPPHPGVALQRFRTDANGKRDVLSMSPIHELWLERPTTRPAGEPVPYTLTLIASAEGVDTYRLDVRAAEGDRFVVHPFHKVPITVGPPATPVTAAPVISLGEEKSSAWTCSSETLRVVQTSLTAPAWRVRWAEHESALGPASPFIIATGGDAGLALGRRNCRGFNLRWSTPIFIEVTALLADG